MQVLHTLFQKTEEVGTAPLAYKACVIVSPKPDRYHKKETGDHHLLWIQMQKLSTKHFRKLNSSAYKNCYTSWPINVINYANRIKDKNHIIFSINADDKFDRIEHPFMIRILNKQEIREDFLDPTKGIWEKPTANTILNGNRLNDSLLKSRLRQGYLFLPLLFKVILENPSGAFREENEIKGIWERKSKYLFLYSMFLYLGDPKNIHLKRLTTTNKQGNNVAGYLINIKINFISIY